MERPPRSKGKIMLGYLQKAATFSITNQPHSPHGGDRRPTARGFSGPIASIVPRDARYKKKTEDVDEEPTSPKVTCIGQIKHKKAAMVAAAAAAERQKKKKKGPSGVFRMLRRRVSPSGRPDREEVEAGERENKRRPAASVTEVADAAAPALGRMRRFASGRETLADFDWEKVVAPENSGDEREEVEVKNVYHSGPILLGGGAVAAEPKEVGLWRRRAMAAPMPLQVNK